LAHRITTDLKGPELLGRDPTQATES